MDTPQQPVRLLHSPAPGLRGGARFELDVGAQRGVARLRAGAALLALFASAWLFRLPELVPRLFALAGVAFGGLWLARIARAPARSPQAHFLEIGPRALTLAQGGPPQLVSWPDVESVAIDQDRLLVVISRRNAPALELSPDYRGVTLDGLAQRIQDALQAARAGRGCADDADG